MTFEAAGLKHLGTKAMLVTAAAIIVTAFFISGIVCIADAAPEKKAKPAAAAAAKKDSGAINDANLNASQKRVEELLKKNEYVTSLRTSLKIYDYTKEVLATVKVIKGHYEKAVNDPAVATKDKERLYLKLKGLDQLIPRYTTAYETSLYSLGYIYARRNEPERARKYLTEYLQTTPFSTSRDSKWMKAKTLLLELYSLEGEF
ncbi:MAG: hypothetical protein PHC90_00615 [Syntrophorhabdaceae bacterium]|nr:hypothetical protein [Syntrophorhabdaceae bacterium]